MGYETDIKTYHDTIDRLSPYHIYQHLYWTLRGKWRETLYQWTRREPCDAQARFSPSTTIAGERYTLTLEIKLRNTTVVQGGRIAVYFPMSFGGRDALRALTCFQGPDGQTGYGSRIMVCSEKQEIQIETIVHSTGSVFTCVEGIVTKGKLSSGDTINVIIGDPSCKKILVGESAKSYVFRVAIDAEGKGDFKPVRPDPYVTNVGNKARYLRVFAPAAPHVKEQFTARVVAADSIGDNPSFNYNGIIQLCCSSDHVTLPGPVRASQDANGTITINGIQTHSEGAFRICAVDKENGIMGQSNPVCPGFAPEPYSIYFGEIHSHTDLSDGVGTPEDSLHWARYSEGFDFTALADHFEDEQSYNYTLEKKWERTKEMIQRYNDPGSFVTLLGYEIGTLAANRNVYFSDGVGKMIVENPDGEKVTMDNVFQKLEGTDYILIPHAPKFHGINWDTPHNSERQRLIEIYSFWGDSEKEGPLSVRSGLDYGYKFGFTGGTDNHYAQPGKKEFGGITAVYAESLTRKDIFKALMARRTYATTGSRMLLRFSVNRSLMGSEITLTPETTRCITGAIIAEEPVALVQVIRNGAVAYEEKGDSREIQIKWEDTEDLSTLCPKRIITPEPFVYYYLRVETVDGEIGWTSPVWVHPIV